jgi:trehalose 6-phosphate phosphatase
LLDRGAHDRAGCGGKPDECRVRDVDVSLERVEDRARERGDPDRRERRSGCEAALEPEEKDQERDDDDAAADAEEGAEETCDEPDPDEFQRHRPYPRAVNGDPLLARIAEAPERTAILLDVDGVLAPIVDVPQDSSVPEETRVELRRLNGRYALVACISGRSSADARRIVGIDELVYVGEHGLELEPEAAAWSDRLQAFATTIDWEDVERKPLTVTFHYRRTENESDALRLLEAVAARARTEGLVARFGRKVLELRPPVGAHKGTAVMHLLGDRGLERALYAGDDTTDLDAFNALQALELGVTVAVSSPEGPAELREAADVVVDGTPAMLELLRSL